MTHVSRYERARARFLAAWSYRGISFKAISFALIGLVNTAVDYCAFLVARAVLNRSASALALFASVSGFCHCGSTATVTLIAANTISWIVAVTGSYVMNSSITFAAESGRKLRWRRLLHVRFFRHCRMDRQHSHASHRRRSLVVASVAGQGLRRPGELCGKLSISHFVVFWVRCRRPRNDGLIVYFGGAICALSGREIHAWRWRAHRFRKPRQRRRYRRRWRRKRQIFPLPDQPLLQLARRAVPTSGDAQSRLPPPDRGPPSARGAPPTAKRALRRL